MPKLCFNETKKKNINPWPLKLKMATFGRKNHLFVLTVIN